MRVNGGVRELRVRREVRTCDTRRMPKSGLRSKLILTAIAIGIVPLLLLLSELGVRIFARKLDPLSVFVASPLNLGDGGRCEIPAGARLESTD